MRIPKQGYVWTCRVAHFLRAAHKFQPCRVASAQDPGFPGWAGKSPLPLCSRGNADFQAERKVGHTVFARFLLFLEVKANVWWGFFAFPEGQIDVSSWFVGWSDPPLTWGIQLLRAKGLGTTSDLNNHGKGPKKRLTRIHSAEY